VELVRSAAGLVPNQNCNTSKGNLSYSSIRNNYSVVQCFKRYSIIIIIIINAKIRVALSR